MSGTLVIWSLIAHNAPVLAVVPIARIKEGDLPVNTTLPAIAITRIDRVPLNMIRTNETPKVQTERVQVSALVKGVEGTPAGLGKKGVDALLALILAACPSQRGVIAGVNVDSIVPDTVGPDLADPTTALYSGSVDFIVRWWAT